MNLLGYEAVLEKQTITPINSNTLKMAVAKDLVKVHYCATDNK